VGAELVEQAVPTLAVAHRDHPLGQQLHAHRGAAVLGKFFREQRWDPVLAEQLAHRCARPGLGQQLIGLLLEQRVIRLSPRLTAIERRGFGTA
jgi:hypothetical protein